MDNYIGKVDAEWVDPVVELPEQGHGIIVRNSDGGVSLAEWHNSPWPMGRWVAWLRIGRPSVSSPTACTPSTTPTGSPTAPTLETSAAARGPARMAIGPASVRLKSKWNN
jgi:hypothetical protein